MADFKHTGYGEVLRRRRTEQGLSLDDMATRTRIRKTYLQALEEENLQALPGTAYVIGFLRIYARELGLPVASLLNTLAGVEATADDEPSSAAVSGQFAPAPGVRRKRRGARVFILLALLLLAMAGYLYLRLRAPDVRPLPPSARAPVVQPPAVMPPPPSPAPPPAVAPSAPGEQHAVATELPVIPAGGAVVRMLAVAGGGMKVSLDGQEAREYQLQSGQSLNWKVTATLAVELPAPGLVRVWVGQEELAVAELATFVLSRSPRNEGRP